MTPHPLITTLVGGFVGAFIFGMIAKRLGIAPIVGFLVAGGRDRAVYTGVCRRSLIGAGAGRDRRRPADVRSRLTFLDRRSHGRSKDRSPRCSLADSPGDTGLLSRKDGTSS